MHTQLPNRLHQERRWPGPFSYALEGTWKAGEEQRAVSSNSGQKELVRNLCGRDERDQYLLYTVNEPSPSLPRHDGSMVPQRVLRFWKHFPTEMGRYPLVLRVRSWRSLTAESSTGRRNERERGSERG
jgi:hypothetical protein